MTTRSEPIANGADELQLNSLRTRRLVDKLERMKNRKRHRINNSSNRDYTLLPAPVDAYGETATHSRDELPTEREEESPIISYHSRQMINTILFLFLKIFFLCLVSILLP